MKKYLSLLTVIGACSFSISSYASIITYNVNASPNPHSLETLGIFTYDAKTETTNTVSDSGVAGSLSGTASFSVNTNDFKSMGKFYRSSDVNDFYMFIDGTTPNHVLSNQVSTQNSQLGSPIVFNRNSSDSDIYTYFDSTSNTFALNMQLNRLNPVRTYDANGSYSESSDYLYTSFYVKGNLTRRSFEDTLLVTAIDNSMSGGWIVQGHYQTTNYFDPQGSILKSDTMLNMQKFDFSADQLNITIDNGSATVAEPQAFWLLGFGLLGLSVFRGRRQNI